MILIASAAYVSPELQTEFGRLPPALLPVGNRRLVEHQLDRLRDAFPDEPVWLSLPASFDLPEKDARCLARRAVHLLRIADRLSLADSLAQALEQALEQTGHLQGRLRLLHGDTWLSTLPADDDLIGLARTQTDYAWETEPAVAGAEAPVWCGWFSFGDAARLHAALRASDGRFTRAVRLYDRERPMVRRELPGWRDFGHVNTYFTSRARMTTERAFNALAIADGCVHKTGLPETKIQAEAAWFAALPPALRRYAPQLLDQGRDAEGRAFYAIEYLPLPPLNEVFVHGRNPTAYWGQVFGLCAEFLQRCADQPLALEARARVAATSDALSGRKTWQRLESFVRDSGHPGLDAPCRLDGTPLPTLREIVEDCLDRLALGSPVPGVLHGDLCLSNILFDSRSDRIKVIDPRGTDADGLPCQVGDLRYDLAKLAHSVLGLYDHIVAGAYELDHRVSPAGCDFTLELHVDQRTRAIQSLFARQRFVGGLRGMDALPLAVLLFLGMLPLHADRPERQWALLANALRLYRDHLGVPAALHSGLARLAA